MSDAEEIELGVVHRPESTTIGLAERSDALADDGPPSTSRVSELPPVDEGRKAWTFCACGFIMEVVIFGWNNAYGVFQEYYSSHPPFANESAAVISIVGTLSTAIQYMLVVVSIAACQRYPEFAKPLMWFSVFTGAASIFISSFATQIWHLILLQGVVFGSCATVLFGPLVVWLVEWFVTRRGLASGLMTSGTGAGGFIVPLILGSLLEKFGFRWTLRIWSLILVVVAGSALLGINPRIPARRPTFERPRPPWMPRNLNFFKSPRFFITLCAFLFQTLAYSPVSIFIPTYASAVSSSPLSSTISLALFNATSLFGYLSFGRISDVYPYPFIIFSVGIGSALSIFLLWGFARTLALVFAFSGIFGALNGGFTAFWPAAATTMSGGRAEHVGIIIGIFAATKGIGAISGPIIAASLRTSVSSSATETQYGLFGFRTVQYFVGSMAVATSLGALGLLAMPRPRTRVPSTGRS